MRNFIVFALIWGLPLVLSLPVNEVANDVAVDLGDSSIAQLEGVAPDRGKYSPAKLNWLFLAIF